MDFIYCSWSIARSNAWNQANFYENVWFASMKYKTHFSKVTCIYWLLDLSCLSICCFKNAWRLRECSSFGFENVFAFFSLCPYKFAKWCYQTLRKWNLFLDTFLFNSWNMMTPLIASRLPSFSRKKVKYWLLTWKD